MEKARETAARVVVSIYVNPTQFGTDEEILIVIPAPIDADFDVIAAEGGCDVIYVPTNIYDSAHSTNIIPSGVALPMEGEARPHIFFAGVANVVSKLFNHIPADCAIFGEKDFQQLAVIRQMVRDLDINIGILAHPTIREADGLALSSRNQYLTSAQRRLAPQIYAQMLNTSALINNGVDINAAICQAKNQLQKAGFGRIDYFPIFASQMISNLAETNSH